MTTIYTDPAEFTESATDGFVDLYNHRLRKVVGGVVRRRRTETPKVAIVVGGGSGHYPAFAGLVGPGFADGAVIGNIFTSPSEMQAYSVGRAAHNGAGVIFAYGNYAGDVMNFGLAGERLQQDGIDARQVLVTDDVASAPADRTDLRRGIAGDFVVFKALAAAADLGLNIDEVERLGKLANARTFTIGLAFSGCTFPGAEQRHFTVPEGKMGLGLGIHGEPGQEDVDWLPADELAAVMVDRLLAERPANAAGRVAVIVNGLGATKYEELFLLYGEIAPRLRAASLTIIAPEVGELVTSLDMGGVSLTLTWLDDELETLWCAPADTPAWRRGSVDADLSTANDEDTVEEVAELSALVVAGSAESAAAAGEVLHALTAMRSLLEAQELHLGRMDAIAGDGDHGRGMVRGIQHACIAAENAARAGSGAAGVLEAAGTTWADRAGGTSGVLWGAGLRAFGAALGNDTAVGRRAVVDGAQAFLDAVVGLGKANLGDKTFVDSATPFVDSLRASVREGADLPAAWRAAAERAQTAADATAPMSPKKGRARPLAARSIGTPDPGAVSFAMCMSVIGDVLSQERTELQS